MSGTSYWKKQRKELPSTLMIIGAGLIIVPIIFWVNDDELPFSEIIDLNFQLVFFGILFLLVGFGLWIRSKAIAQNVQPQGLGKTSNIITLIVVFVVAWGFVYGISLYDELTEGNTNDSENKQITPYSQKSLDAIKTVQNYKGKDGTGSTLIEAIALIVQLFYFDEDIVNHPSTKMGWDALLNVELLNGIYDVYFDFKTYDRNEEFHFLVDTKSNEVWAGNSLGSEVLKLLDADTDSQQEISKRTNLDPDIFCTENTKKIWSLLKLEDLYEEKAKEICS